jgi:hypothetical protein
LNTALRNWTGKLIALVAGLAATALLFIDACDLFYRCGCQSWWVGAAASCNIHTAGVPHCPWCIEDGQWGYAAFGLIVLAQACCALGPYQTVFWKRLALTLAAFPIVAATAALLFGWWTGYWSG